MKPKPRLPNEKPVPTLGLVLPNVKGMLIAGAPTVGVEKAGYAVLVGVPNMDGCVGAAMLVLAKLPEYKLNKGCPGGCAPIGAAGVVAT